MVKEDLGVRAIGVKSLLTTKVKPNPHNPRMLFDRDDLTVLEESISRVGVLVPLTVYRESSTGDYVILDGQRRWLCAKKLGLKKVPVNEVAEPTLVQNIVTMFQIHRLRKDWELMPTALKLQVLMDELEERNQRRLSALTGLDEAVVARCKKLLSFSPKYQDMMLDIDPKKRAKPDFFIELYAVLSDRHVKSFEWYSRSRFIEAMLKKQAAGGLKAVTDFRRVKQSINNAVKAGKKRQVSKRLKQFVDSPELAPDHLEIQAASVVAESKKIRKVVGSLRSQLAELDVDQFYGEGMMWDELQALSSLIRTLLTRLGRRAAK